MGKLADEETRKGDQAMKDASKAMRQHPPNTKEAAERSKEALAHYERARRLLAEGK
jgi:hypothetical protein